MANEKPTMALSAEDLQKIIAAAVTAAKAPVDPTPEQIAALEQEQEMRRQQAQLVRDMEATRKRNQEACTHKRRDGSTPAVFVQCDGDAYMVCQHCQKIIRKEEQPLFNELFQLTQSAATF